MKFLDLVKVYIRSGSGGAGRSVLGERKILNMVALMEEMVGTEVLFGLKR